MVWMSSKQSLENREVSFLAIIETIIAVGLYWYIAFYFDFYWHLIISIGITPFLLLQSTKSIEDALSLFKDNKGREFKNLFVEQLYKIVALIIIIVLSAPLFMVGYSNWTVNFLVQLFVMLIFAGILVGIAVALDSKKDKTESQEDSTKNRIEDIIVLLLIIPLGTGIGIGSVVTFSTIKIISVFTNLLEGYRNIKSNWFYLVFVQDMKKIPEVMTGIESDSEIKEIYKISKLVSLIMKSGNIFRRILSAVLFVSLYPFAVFYRLSIKSTFWFYIPLLIVVRIPDLNNSSQVGKFLSEQYQTLWAWLRGFLAFGTILAFTITYFNYYTFSEVNNIPFIAVVSMLYLDFSSIEVWKVFQLLVALLTIGLFLYANAIRVPSVSNNIPLKNDYRVMTIYYLNSLRNWISLFYFISAFIFLAYYFRVWEYRYIPHFMESLLSNLVQYIQYKPFG